MRRKRIFFLTLNYIEIILSFFFLVWVFVYKKISVLDEDYIGLFVLSMLFIFIANSLTNIFSANDLANQMTGNKILATAKFILILLFILSVGLMLIVSVVGFYTSFIERRDGFGYNLGAIVAILLSITSLIVLMNQYYFGQQLKKEYREKLESQIDIIGIEPSTHE